MSVALAVGSNVLFQADLDGSTPEKSQLSLESRRLDVPQSVTPEAMLCLLKHTCSADACTVLSKLTASWEVSSRTETPHTISLEPEKKIDCNVACVFLIGVAVGVLVVAVGVALLYFFRKKPKAHNDSFTNIQGVDLPAQPCNTAANFVEIEGVPRRHLARASVINDVLTEQDLQGTLGQGVRSSIVEFDPSSRLALEMSKDDVNYPSTSTILKE